MMWLIDQIAEKKIVEAQQRGEFDELTGAGKPLVLDDDTAVPEELRNAYRILKNSGYLPEPLQLRKDITALEGLIAQVQSVEQMAEFSKRRSWMLLKLSMQSPNSAIFSNPEYVEKIGHIK